KFAILSDATSEILSPACKISSTIAAILASVRIKSRSALYSIWVKNFGVEFSTLGWATIADGSVVIIFSAIIHLKKVFTSFSFLETDFGVYFLVRRVSRKLSKSEA